MDIELFLRLVNLQLDIFLHDDLLRIVTSPTHKYITKCRKIPPQPRNPTATTKETAEFTRLSPLHKLELCFTAIYHHKLKSLEHCIPFPIPPCYKHPTVHISASAELAISKHKSLTTSSNYLAIYTDGSGIKGCIGASAVTIFNPWPGAPRFVAREKHAFTGSDQQFTVYFGELYGLLMALDLIVDDNSNRKALIFRDNQAAITSSEQPKQQSGQYLLQEIALRIETLSRQLENHSIPADSGVPGNESADIAAEKMIGWRATGPPSATSDTPTNPPTMTSAYNTTARYPAKEQWAENWKTEKHGRITFKLTSEPSASVPYKSDNMTRAKIRVIVQARTGKIGLQSYLRSIGAKDSELPLWRKRS